MYNSGIGSPYWFEWDIGVLECLNMLQDTSIESIVFQSTDFQVLDDVVINYSDKSIVNIQVKHTDANGNFTYSFLASGKKPLLNELAFEWKNNKNNYCIKQIQIVTNRKWGMRMSGGKCSMESFISKVFPCLQKNYNYISTNLNEQKAIEWYKKALEKQLDPRDAESFTKILSFRKESCLTDVEDEIRIKICEILGTDNSIALDFCMNNLLSKLRTWATSTRKKPEVLREDVYAALCYSKPSIPQYEIWPKKPILPSRIRFAATFVDSIKSNDNHIIFLEGLPGSGKTNFISYLSQMDESIVDFRFYTYLPVDKMNGSYSDDEGYYLGRYLWSSILEQLKKKFEEKQLLSKVNFPLIYQYMSETEKRETVIRFLPEYAKCIGRPCYFFIDGIDHAARSNNARDTFLSQLPRPGEVGDELYFVLVGQPVNDGYPSWLKENPNISYFKMPSLETDDVIVLLKESGVAEKNVDIESLAETVISIIGNNVLNIIFAILELKRMELPLSFEEIEYELNKRFLNKKIDKYYEWIINALDENLLLNKIETIFAFSSNRISAFDVAQMCGVKLDEATYILNQLHPIILCEDGEYFAFHNDVRLFLQNKTIHNSNIKTIADSITDLIQAERNLWKYRYDISFNLGVKCQGIQKVTQLMDVGYIMDSVLYKVSFDKILQQFAMVLQLPVENLSKEGIYASAISLCLTQYANCIWYYQKETDYIEKHSNNLKTKSEKYCLNIESDLEQIISDTYFATKVEFKRGNELFNEYFSGHKIEELYKRELNNDSFSKLGYIYRCYSAACINEIDDSDSYVDFVDGWLEASSQFSSEEAIKQTFSFRKYRADVLSSYASRIIEDDNLSEKAYNLLLDILLTMHAPIDILINLCVYGLLKAYNSENGIIHISQHLDEIKNKGYEYEDSRIVSLIKAYFCVYGRIDESVIENCYNEILNLTHNGESLRGHEPAMAQYDISQRVFKQFYSPDQTDILTKDDIFLLMYFSIKFGAGSVFDCHGYAVIEFLRKVLVSFAGYNPKADVVTLICDTVIQSLSFDDVQYVPEFNILFRISDAHTDFLKVAKYWCGEEGAAWRSEFDDMESYCKSIIPILEYFGENEFINKIIELQKYRLFGYIGRKDYSLYGLFDCYKKIPLTEAKLCDYGMRLFSISESANALGDNRSSNEVDRELFDDAVKLGYKYCNALFELRNTPKDLVYWRMKVIDSLYSNIDLINDDSELVSLYNLTNAWIKSNIEQDRPYNRLEALKTYNHTVISRISDPQIQKELMEKGLCEVEEKADVPPSKEKTDSSEIENLLRNEGYSERVEKLLLTHIEEKAWGLYRVILDDEKLISEEHLESFVNRCVIKFILAESKYGYIGSGMLEVFERYFEKFNEDSWKVLFEDIISRFEKSDYDVVASLWGDFTFFSLYYLLQKDKDKIQELFCSLCETHEKLLSANGRINLKHEELILNDDIKSLSDMVNYQLNIS